MSKAPMMRRLKFVATINDDALPETTDVDYELQYIDIGNVTSAGEILDIVSYTFGDAPSRARRQVQHGDVIVSTVRTYLKAIAPIENPPENLIVSTGFAVVRPKPEFLSSRFCKYLLREASFIAEVERRSSGVSYPAINASDLGDIMVPVPTLAEQEAISNFLDRETARLKRLAVARQRQLQLLEEKRVWSIAHVVTNGVNIASLKRDSGVPWLGSIPSHWKVVQLKRLCEKILTGSTPKELEEPTATDEVVNWFTPGDLSDEEIRLISSERKLFAHLLDSNSISWFPPSSVLVVGVGASLGKVGILSDYGSANQQLNALLPKEGILPLFVAYQMQVVRPVLMASSLASTLPILSQQRMGEIRVVMPPIVEQEAIAVFIKQKNSEFEMLRNVVMRSLNLIHQKRNSLISTAITRQTTLSSLRHVSE